MDSNPGAKGDLVCKGETNYLRSKTKKKKLEIRGLDILLMEFISKIYVTN